MKTIFESPRLFLREFVIEDAQDLFELDSDPEVMRYLGHVVWKSIKEAEATIRKVQQQYAENNGVGRLVMIDKENGAFLGWSGLQYEHQFRKPNFSYYDLGYRLKRKYWGKGYATEAATATLDYGFNTLKLAEINAAAHIDNQASNHILRKLGLQFLETFDRPDGVHNWYRITAQMR